MDGIAVLLSVASVVKGEDKIHHRGHREHGVKLLGSVSYMLPGIDKKVYLHCTAGTGFTERSPHWLRWTHINPNPLGQRVSRKDSSCPLTDRISRSPLARKHLRQRDSVGCGVQLRMAKCCKTPPQGMIRTRFPSAIRCRAQAWDLHCSVNEDPRLYGHLGVRRAANQEKVELGTDHIITMDRRIA